MNQIFTMNSKNLKNFDKRSRNVVESKVAESREGRTKSLTQRRMQQLGDLQVEDRSNMLRLRHPTDGNFVHLNICIA
jgi:hypothetical protein